MNVKKFLSFSLIICAFSSFADNPIITGNTIILAVENSWPPYSDENGNGISKDKIKQAYKTVNTSVKFITVPYARALKMVENGEVDGAFNVTKQSSTSSKFNFGEMPILKAKSSYFYPKNSPLNFKNVLDIPNGTSIALMIDYEYGEEFEQNKKRFKEVRVKNQKQIIQLLRHKRVDLAIMFDEVAKATLTEMALAENEIQKGQLNHVSDIYVAFSKQKNSHRALQLLDQGLKNTLSE